MDHRQTSYHGSVPSSFSSEVDGTTRIIITSPKATKMEKPSSLWYYKGEVKSGSQSNRARGVNATVFCFSSSAAAGDVYSRLVAFDNPYIIEALGYGGGYGEHSKYSFLAITSFTTTFESYVQKNGPGADHNNRFTEEFIKIVSDIISGMDELHKCDYYCPNLKGDDIAIIKEYNSTSAKIWNFEKCKSEKNKKDKDADWIRLGLLMLKVSWTKEANDLFDRIKSGELKGFSILKHSAFLTVRQKFENVLSLDLHVSLEYMKGAQTVVQNEGIQDLRVTDVCTANLGQDLDRRLNWVMPSWIFARCLTTQPRTLRGFIHQLKIIIEHEVDFIPPTMICEFSREELLKGAKKKDLEHQCQKNWAELFVALQKLVADLGLKY